MLSAAAEPCAECILGPAAEPRSLLQPHQDAQHRTHYTLLVRVTALVLGPNGNTAGLNAPLKTPFFDPGAPDRSIPWSPTIPYLCHRMHADPPEGPRAAGGCQEHPLKPPVPLQCHHSRKRVAKTPTQLWLDLASEPQCAAAPIALHPQFERWHFLAETQVTHEHGVLHTQVGGCRASHSCAAGQQEHQASFPSQGASPGTL